MKTLITKIYKEIGGETQLNKIIRAMEGKKTIGEIQYQHMAYDKVYDYFNWRPSYDIDMGIREAIKWYKTYFDAISTI